MADNIIPKDIAKDYLAKMAKKAFYDLDAASCDAVANFYGGYSPKMYKRTEAMYGLYVPEIKTSDDEFEVKFTFYSGLLAVNGGDSGWAFSTGFVAGMHGGSKAWGHPRNVPVTSPSPWELIKQFAESYNG